MSLSKIQSLRIAAVLEDCAYQLDILGHSQSAQIRRERGAASSKEKARLAKLNTDCQFITEQISKLCFELEEKQTFYSICQTLEEEKKPKEADKLREGEANLKQRKMALVRQKQEIEDRKDQINKMQLLLNELENRKPKKKKKKKPKTTSMSQVMLAQTWQRAQLTDQLELLQKQIEDEKSSHEKSKKFLQNQHEELQQIMHKWKQQTKQMQQSKQSRFDNLGCKRTLNIDRLMEMRRKYREMEQVVLEDKKEQEKLRQQEAEARAATKLQAWWRGYMVRRSMGAFKKADGSKKGKKKKGKKK